VNAGTPPVWEPGATEPHLGSDGLAVFERLIPEARCHHKEGSYMVWKIGLPQEHLAGISLRKPPHLSRTELGQCGAAVRMDPSVNAS